MKAVWLTDTITDHLARSVSYTLLWGLDGIVLRSMERSRVPDVNEAKLRVRLAESDLELAAIDPGLFEGHPDDRALWLNDLERLTEAAAFCTRSGCQRILVGALPEGPIEMAAEVLRRAAERIEGSDLQICVRNAGPGRSSSAEICRLIQKIEHPSVSIGWDPAHAFSAAGEDEIDLPNQSIGFVAVRNVVRQGELCSPARFAQGELPWTDILRELSKRDYAGPLCLVFDQVNPSEAFQDATELIHAIRQVQRAE